jgi:hypothetical protein
MYKLINLVDFVDENSMHDVLQELLEYARYQSSRTSSRQEKWKKLVEQLQPVVSLAEVGEL